MTKKVIGIIGTIGAGKDTAGDYISRKLGIPSYQISSPLKAILLAKGEESTRENLIALGSKLATEKGDSYLAEYVVAHAPESMIITGMRQLGQISYLKTSTELVLISIDANPVIRFDRVGRNGKTGEARTIDKFIEREKAENNPPNVQRLFECMKLADYRITNEGTFTDLYHELDMILDKIQ